MYVNCFSNFLLKYAYIESLNIDLYTCAFTPCSDKVLKFHISYIEETSNYILT